MLNDIATEKKIPYAHILEEEIAAMDGNEENETVIIVLDEDHRETVDSHMVFYITTPEQQFVADKTTAAEQGEGKGDEAKGNENEGISLESSNTDSASTGGCFSQYKDISAMLVINENGGAVKSSTKKFQHVEKYGKAPDDPKNENNNLSVHLVEKTERLDKSTFVDSKKFGKTKRGRPRKHYPSENAIMLPDDKLLKPTISVCTSSCANRRVGRPSKYLFGEDGSLTIVDCNNVKRFPGSTDTGGNLYMCDVCKMQFKSARRLKSHRVVHSDKKPYKCSVCGKRFKRKLTLDQHVLAHAGNDCYTCTVCGKACETAFRFVQHMKIHTDNDKRSCEMCGQTFNCESTMRRHMFSHAKRCKFSCGICSRVFRRPELVQSHMRVHMDYKPFPCNRCAKAFKRKSDLNRHLILHSGSKPYVCGVCGVSFADQSSCHRHVREHNSLKKYSCLLCSESFKRAEALRSHVLRKHPHDDVSIYKDANNALQFVFKDAEAKTRHGNMLSAESVSNVLHQVAEGEVVALLTSERPDEVMHVTSGQGEQVLVQVSENFEVETSTATGASGDELITIIKLPETEADSNNLSRTTQAIQTEDCKNILTETIVPLDNDNLDKSMNNKEANEHQVQTVAEVQANLTFSTATQASKRNGDQNDAFTCSDLPNSTPCSKKSMESMRTKRMNTVLDAASNDIVSETDIISSGNIVVDMQNDFIKNPDFQSEDYYTWLIKYVENVKSVSPPICSDVYLDVTHLYKTLADALAEQKCLMADKQNIFTLLSIIKDLHESITRHLHSVLGCLDAR